MKLERNNMFHTPETNEELQANIENYAAGPERLAFVMGMMLTWNFIAKVLEDAE